MLLAGVGLTDLSRKSEISYSHIASGCYQNVCWLQIPVNDPGAVQVCKATQQLVHQALDVRKTPGFHARFHHFRQVPVASLKNEPDVLELRRISWS